MELWPAPTTLRAMALFCRGMRSETFGPSPSVPGIGPASSARLARRERRDAAAPASFRMSARLCRSAPRRSSWRCVGCRR